jgi:hypothetical protein
MTRFSRVIAPPLLSAAIFGATLGLAGTPGAVAARSVNNDANMQPIQDPRMHQMMPLR